MLLLNILQAHLFSAWDEGRQSFISVFKNLQYFFGINITTVIMTTAAPITMNNKNRWNGDELI